MTPTKSINAAINPLFKENPVISESEKHKFSLVFPFSLGCHCAPVWNCLLCLKSFSRGDFYWLTLLINVKVLKHDVLTMAGFCLVELFLAFISPSCPIEFWGRALVVDDQSQSRKWLLHIGDPIDKRWGIWFCVLTTPRVHPRQAEMIDGMVICVQEII